MQWLLGHSLTRFRIKKTLNLRKFLVKIAKVQYTGFKKKFFLHHCTFWCIYTEQKRTRKRIFITATNQYELHIKVSITKRPWSDRCGGIHGFLLLRNIYITEKLGCNMRMFTFWSRFQLTWTSIGLYAFKCLLRQCSGNLSHLTVRIWHLHITVIWKKKRY